MNYYKELLDILNGNWEKDIELKRGEYLVNEGEVHTNLYYVEEGSVRVFIYDEVEEHTIRFGYPNSLITALDSFLTKQPTNFFIQAIKKCKLKCISKSSYDNLLRSDPNYTALWLKMMEVFVYQQIEREIDLLTFSPTKRFERLFRRSPQFFQEIPQKYIASYLRMTPETLSRILKNID